MKKVKQELKEYKKIIAYIKCIEIDIEELEENEGTAEQIQELILLKNKATRRIKSINNAMSILSDREREILEFIFINHNKYYMLEERIHLSYPAIKRIERIALKKIEKYII